MAAVDINYATHYRARAVQLEEWAVGAIEKCTDQQTAHEIISLRCSPTSSHEGDTQEQNTSTAIDIAMGTKCKVFLSHRHCTSLQDRWWRGGFEGSSTVLPQGFSWLVLLYNALFPFTNPLIWAKRCACLSGWLPA